MNDWVKHSLKINEKGLIYCERMITIDKLMDRSHSTKGDMDYYQMLSDNYDGVGEC